jgi:hypothetical protein
VPVQTFRTLDRTKGIDAMFNEVFVVRKPDPSKSLKIFTPSLPKGFDGDFYLSANPDVANAGLDPVAHYLQFGWREGRKLK